MNTYSQLEMEVVAIEAKFSGSRSSTSNPISLAIHPCVPGENISSIPYSVATARLVFQRNAK
jgi:hypothetical protein